MLRCIRIQHFVKLRRLYCTVNSLPINVKISNEDDTKEILEQKAKFSEENKDVLEHSKLVAAAFASLKEISFNSKYKRRSSSVIWEQINDAKDMNTLLAIAEFPYITRQHALKIVSILAQWASVGKITLADFETDRRFVKVCQILGRSSINNAGEDMADLSVVLGVTADEQAAKLISSISLTQMIKILKSLCAKRRRSTPLLRSLAFNISRIDEKLNIKEASDIFFALASLNYPDEVLLDKVCEDIRKCLKDNKNPAVVNSIALSMGKIRYRNEDLLDQICLWTIKNRNICRKKDFFSILLTLANVNYISEYFPQFYEILEEYLDENEILEVNLWIDIVWSLVLLKKYNKKFIDSVLNPTFISKFTSISKSIDTEIDVSRTYKILNINGIAKQLKNEYEGNLLEENSLLFSTPVRRNKEKQQLFNSVMEAFSNLIKIEDFIQIDVNSGMGFLIDAVCFLDPKHNFVKLNSEQKEEKSVKVAIMIYTYHDFCRVNCHELNGITALSHRLLVGMGYKVVSIPYTEYNSKEYLTIKLQYLNQKLKENTTEE